MTKSYGKDHRGCLVSPHRRGEYAEQVIAWLERALPYYSRDNVKKTGYTYAAEHDAPPHFEYDSGENRWSCQPARPSDVLFINRGDYQKARRQLYAVAETLLREGHAADLKQLRQRIKDELL